MDGSLSRILRIAQAWSRTAALPELPPESAALHVRAIAWSPDGSDVLVLLEQVLLVFAVRAEDPGRDWAQFRSPTTLQSGHLLAFTEGRLRPCGRKLPQDLATASTVNTRRKPMGGLSYHKTS